VGVIQRKQVQFIKWEGESIAVIMDHSDREAKKLLLYLASAAAKSSFKSLGPSAVVREEMSKG